MRFELRLFAHQCHIHERLVLQQHFDGVHHVHQVVVPPETVLRRRVHVRYQLRTADGRKQTNKTRVVRHGTLYEGVYKNGKKILIITIFF